MANAVITCVLGAALGQLSAALVPALGEERVAALQVWLHSVIGRELAAMEASTRATPGTPSHVVHDPPPALPSPR